MGAGRLKGTAPRITYLMNMDGMLTRRQIFQIQADAYAFAPRRQRGRTYAFSLAILQSTV
jgi:hypothetical protein